MKNILKSKVSLLVISSLFFGGVFFMPLVSQEALAQNQGQEMYVQTAGGQDSYNLIPCGRSSADGSAEGDPCTVCHAILTGKTFLDYLTSIMVIVALAVITAMGVLYILSGANADFKKQAKSGLTAVFWGLVFMLSSWLIVSTILFYLASDGFINGDGRFFGITKGDGAFGLSCSTYSEGNTGELVEGSIRYTLRSGGGGGNGGAASSSGSCQPINDAGNLCSTQALSNTCFKDNVNIWSGICNFESGGGQRSIPSSTDICTNLGRKSFSGGIFQINILANGRYLDAEKCNDLGSHDRCLDHSSGGACISWSCTAGSDYANWDYCMRLTFDPQTNYRVACVLSDDGHKTTPWPHTSQVICRVPRRI